MSASDLQNNKLKHLMSAISRAISFSALFKWASSKR
jgi:hypothetical protein